jgi:hypothetical protein
VRGFVIPAANVKLGADHESSPISVIFTIARSFVGGGLPATTLNAETFPCESDTAVLNG